MKKSGFFVLILLFGIGYSGAQIEIVGLAGTCNYLGDLGGKGAAGTSDLLDIDWQGTRYVTGIGVRYKFAQTLGIRVLGYYGRINGDDKYTSYAPRRDRNLSFVSPVYGSDLTAELHFLRSRKYNLGPYVFVGIGYFKFNPMTRYNGKWVSLQPLGTEGQFFMPGKSPYQLQSLSIPFGIGWKFATVRHGYFAVELDARKSFTDYLDDVSTVYADKTQLLASNGQMAVDLSDRSISPDPNFSAPGAIRGKPGNNDTYFFFSFSYNLIIGGKNQNHYRNKSTSGSGNKNNQKCFQF